METQDIENYEKAIQDMSECQARMKLIAEENAEDPTLPSLAELKRDIAAASSIGYHSAKANAAKVFGAAGAVTGVQDESETVAPCRIHHGLILWMDGCPALDDLDNDKMRPLVIVDPDVVEPSVTDPTAMLVACSATYGADEPDGLLMPNLTTEPQTDTGLPKICWAIPRWHLPFSHAARNKCEYSGTLGGRKLQLLLKAYRDRIVVPPP